MNLTIITITLCGVLAFQVVPFVMRQLEPERHQPAKRKEPFAELSAFVESNTELYDYWKQRGNEEYANAHKMLINAFTIEKKEENE